MRKKPQYDIYTALSRNFKLLYIVVIISGLVSLASLFFSYKTFLYTLNNMLTIDKNGEVIPLSMVKRADNIHIEIKSHVDEFIHAFYEYDFNNYKSQMEKAFNLSDKSVEQIYLKKLNEGWFNQVRQLDIIQKISLDPKNIKVTSLQEPYMFSATFTLDVIQGEAINSYEIEVSGYIIIVNRNYPKNSHGLLIVRYVEDEIKTKIDE